MNYIHKIHIVEKYFKGTKYNDSLNETLNYYKQENWVKVDECVKKFPTEMELFETLVNKLKTKSVYQGLKDIYEGKGKGLDELKALFSFGCHICIESKQNPEYKMLLVPIFEKIANLLYNLK
jgi:hypothetical protein